MEDLAPISKDAADDIISEFWKACDEGREQYWIMAKSAKTLLERKAYKTLGCKSWNDFCESNLGMSGRQVRRIIEAYEKRSRLLPGIRAELGEGSDVSEHALRGLPKDISDDWGQRLGRHAKDSGAKSVTPTVVHEVFIRGHRPLSESASEFPERHDWMTCPCCNAVLRLEAGGLVAVIGPEDGPPEASCEGQEPPVPVQYGDKGPFDDWYAIYPRKVGKQAARRAYEKAIKKISHDQLIDRTAAYMRSVSKWPAQNMQYVPYPSAWLNKGHYDDDPAEWDRNAEEDVVGETIIQMKMEDGIRPDEIPF
jgi:hypothetical protein